MTLILVKGNSQAKYLVTKERAEKSVTVDGNPNTTIKQLTPLEANREINDLIRRGWTKKQPA